MRAGTVVLILLLWLGAGPGLAGEARPWARLTDQERAALAPLAPAWDSLTTRQREKLLDVAQGFAKLAPAQQRLLHSRLRAWSRMSSEERQIARDNYKKIQALPEADQARIRQQWLDSLCQEFGQPGRTPPAPAR